MPNFSEPLTLLNGAGSTTVSASNTAGSLTLGGGGTGGELILRSATEQAVASIDADNGDMILGGNGQSGDVILRDGSGATRVRLDADDQRLEVLDASGKIIGMLGGSGNIRAGTNGLNGNLFLYPSTATDIFNASQPTVQLDASAADVTLGGNGRSGDVILRDGSGATRVRLDADDQRLEVLDASGKIIGMLGGSGNIRAGTNGLNGNLFLYPSTATDIFNTSQPTVRLDASVADLTLGGNGRSGDVILRDANGTTRARLDADDQRIELLNASGQIIGMMGGSGNIRSGTNGLNGNLYLYPSSATDIFNNGAATIHLDANTGDITLRNADCAEEFEVLPNVCAEPGTVMALGDDGRLCPSSRAHETAVVGVVSGAGDYQPGIVLDKQTNAGRRRPIALVGKTYVKVTDEGGPIRIGDLLTSSGTEGHAMRATDRSRAFGAVIGKAIAPHEQGAGLIPMVIALQ